jgi:hypothetical protein
MESWDGIQPTFERTKGREAGKSSTFEGTIPAGNASKDRKIESLLGKATFSRYRKSRTFSEDSRSGSIPPHQHMT